MAIMFEFLKTLIRKKSLEFLETENSLDWRMCKVAFSLHSQIPFSLVCRFDLDLDRSSWIFVFYPNLNLCENGISYGC